MILSVVWCACPGERVRHVHVSGWRICRPTLRVGEPLFWLRDGQRQPVSACKRCQRLLDAAMKTTGAGRKALGIDAP